MKNLILFFSALAVTSGFSSLAFADAKAEYAAAVQAQNLKICNQTITRGVKASGMKLKIEGDIEYGEYVNSKSMQTGGDKLLIAFVKLSDAQNEMRVCRLEITPGFNNDAFWAQGVEDVSIHFTCIKDGKKLNGFTVMSDYKDQSANHQAIFVTKDGE